MMGTVGATTAVKSEWRPESLELAAPDRIQTSFDTNEHVLVDKAGAERERKRKSVELRIRRRMEREKQAEFERSQMDPMEPLIAAIKRGEDCAALAAYENLKAVNQPPCIPPLYELYLARLLDTLNRSLEAAAACRRAVAQDPGGPQAMRATYLLARLMDERVKRPQQAMLLFQWILKKGPESPYADLARTRLKQLLAAA